MNLLRLLSFYLSAILLVPLVTIAADGVIITEIMYQPASLSTNEEWIEIHNAGTNTVDLRGWRFSQGINFTFSNAFNLPPGGYAVVCADFAVFAGLYPAVAASGRVVGNWSGTLRNSGESIQIEDAAGNNVDTVSYADEGDWGVRVRGELIRNHRGWDWYAAHSGTGRTLELANRLLSNNDGQNWKPSAVFGGTPGAVNSVDSTNTAPYILETAHAPLVPRSTDSVTITTRIVAPPGAATPTARLFYRNDANPQVNPFAMALMFDDGAHNDGLAGDGVFTGSISARPSGTIVEFYVEASSGGLTNTWPGPVQAASDGGGPTGQVANALFQFDNVHYSGSQPLLRLVMTEAERVELYTGINGGDRQSDALMNCSLISNEGSGTDLRYRVGTRIRGAGSRGAVPPNQRVEVPRDQPWHGLEQFNVNCQVSHAQAAGANIAARAGLDAEYGRAVQVRINGINMANSGAPQFGSYVQLETIDGIFIDTHYPLDNGGNAYRASTGNHSATFAYLGTSPSSYINAGYSKQNNNSENDWSDLVNLTDALSNSSDAEFVARVREHANVEQWMRYFAVFTLLESEETSLATGRGDDYALYRGAIDPRFRIVSHDFDTILGQGGGSSVTRDIWRMTNVVNIGRLMRAREFTPLYYASMLEQLDGAFSLEQVTRTLDESLGSWVAAGTIVAMKTFATNRLNYVRTQIPLALTVSSSLSTVSGFPQATIPSAVLFGSSHAAETRGILVNGLPAEWTPMGARWTNTVSLRPGINRILVQSLNSNAVEFARATYDVWYDDATMTDVSGTLAANTTWMAANGPYRITSTLTIPAGVTLTVQAGATVYLSAGAGLTVYGRLLAEGAAESRIRFTRFPGGANWGGLAFVNTGTNESRLAHLDIDSAAGTTLNGRLAQVNASSSRLFVGNLSFGNTPAVQYLAFDASSFVVEKSLFPSYPGAATAPPLLTGTNGIPAGGHAILRDNYFGRTFGSNDTLNFSGGNRPSPILQIIGNTFDGAGDDQLELNSADAWIESNTFIHVHRDLGRTDDPTDTASAISGGVTTAGQYSEWTILHNLFYDLDHAVTVRQGNRFAFLNNTVARMAGEGGSGNSTDIAFFNFNDRGAALPASAVGAGAFIGNNILWDSAQLAANYNPANHTVIFTNNLLPAAWSGPGGGNVVADPRLNLALITSPANAAPNTVRSALVPRSGSLALGTGWGAKYDKGAGNPTGLMIIGEPQAPTPATTATLTVLPGSTLNWGSNPYLWGYTHYKWKLDNGSWSVELPITANPTISLSGLTAGSHTVYAVGRNDAGYYQDDSFVYPADASIPEQVTASRTWIVTNTPGTVRLSEVLAQNSGAVRVDGETPDLLELHNPGDSPFDLGNMGITDDPVVPYKYLFPPGTTIPAGGYLTLMADAEKTPAGIHIGFGLNRNGDALYLFEPPGRGGALVDSLIFGMQLEDFSIARFPDGTWALATPTFGASNQAVSTGGPFSVLINEWRAAQSFGNDFVELLNTDTLPVDLGGLFITDTPQTAPNLHTIPPLTFISAGGYLVMMADGETELGADHLSFRLSPDRGEIALYSPALDLIDWIQYGPQSTDVSQGRSPNASPTLALFPQPTPGGPNPGPGNVLVVVSNRIANFFNYTNKLWRFNSNGVTLASTWPSYSFNDSAWPTGFGLLGRDSDIPFPYPVPIRTAIPAPSQGGPITVYYRTRFTWTNSGWQLWATNFLDDGAIIYLNGVEAARIRMGAGIVDASTLAGNQNSEGQADTVTLPTGSLVIGENQLAVEVHQSATSSSDDIFGLSLAAVLSTTNVIPISIALNEVMASNQSYTNLDGTITDWAEIYNPSTNTVDLSDMSLSDDITNPRRWVFPSGVSLVPGAYLIVKFDPNSAPSTNTLSILNTGFGFSSGGDRVLLYDKQSRGGALVDSVAFGLQAADFSIARVPNATGSWMLALPTERGANIAAALGDLSAVRVNEWMADPRSGEDWFELYNPNAQPVDISGCYLTDNLSDRTQYRIPNLSFIGAGLNGYVEFIADSSPSAGADHTNFRLSAGGESIGLFALDGLTVINAISFQTQARGVSEGRFPDGTTNIIRFVESSTPGRANFLPLKDILINEALTHSDPPLEDAIELRNLSVSPINIGGWYLSDAPGSPRKFRIPDNTIVQSGGFVVFFENQFNSTPGVGTSFSLSSGEGDQVHLSVADVASSLTGYRVTEDFGPQVNGVTFGNHETSLGYNFVAMSARSFGIDTPSTVEQFRTATGTTNPYPLVGPVVITEVHYHPPDIGTNDNTGDEFIELYNFAATNAPLHDPARPTNTWRFRNAVEFDFPPGVTLPARSYLLVVGFDPATNVAETAAFRTRYGVGVGVPIYGPLTGKLANDEDNLELRKPDAPNASDVPTVLVERVRYADKAPWPPAADWSTNGTRGISLQRISPVAFANDPTNWVAGTPTAGATNGAAFGVRPTLTLQPTNRSVTIGTPVTFIASATGPSLSYQWRFNGFDISNATNVSYTVPSAQFTNAGRYSLRVMNAFGVVLSTNAVLSLATLPEIVYQPQSRSGIIGQSVSFTVGARGTPPLGYQWRKNGSNIFGAIGVTLTLSDLQLSDAGDYTVVVSNANGSVSSDIAVLNFNAKPLITSQPVSTNVFVSQTATFNVVAIGSTPISYQWRFNGANIGGGTAPTLNVFNAQTNQAGGYSVLVSNAFGMETSVVASLTVAVPPAVTVSAPDANAAEAGLDSGQFTISRTGPVNYALTVLFSVSGTAQNGGDFQTIASPVVIPTGAASVMVPIIPLDDAGAENPETVVLTLGFSPDYVISGFGNAMVTIADNDNLLPTVSLTAPANNAFYVVSPTNIQVSATASDPEGGVVRVEFYNNGTNKIGEIATLGPYVFLWTNAPPGTNTLTARAIDNFGASAISAPVTISVNGAPGVFITSPASGALYPEGSIDILANAIDTNGTVTRVDFFVNDMFLASVTNAPYMVLFTNATLGSHYAYAVAYDEHNVSGVSPLVTFTAVNANTNLANMFTNRGFVNGLSHNLLGNNANADKEPGEPRHWTNSTGTDVSTRSVWISWSAPAIGGVSIDTFFSTFDTILAVYTNPPGSSATVSNLVLVANSDDSSNVQSRVLFTNAFPGRTYYIAVAGFNNATGTVRLRIALSNTVPYITTQPASQTHNPGANVSFFVGAIGVQPMNYQWRFNREPIANATNSALALANVQSMSGGAYDVVVSNSFGSVTSVVAMLTVRSAPFITGHPSSQTVAPGSDAVFTVTATGGSLFYQWRFNNANIQGANSASYTRFSVGPADIGSYVVVITNSFGSITSNPAILSLSGGGPVLTAMRRSNDVFSAVLSGGTLNRAYHIEVSTNLNAWAVLKTVTNATGEVGFTDTNNAPRRMYRAREVQ